MEFIFRFFDHATSFFFEIMDSWTHPKSRTVESTSENRDERVKLPAGNVFRIILISCSISVMDSNSNYSF